MSDSFRNPAIRNVAIIAHVDHGKTTLVDGLLRLCKVFRDASQMRACHLDSLDQERERGITILAKNIALTWKGVKINLIDTPGHADFGGEVERVLGMADGVLLLVDAFEGPMPQTRFVLKKALARGLVPAVIITKIDRPDCQPERVLDSVFDLFCELDADEHLLESFPHVFVSARDGLARAQPADPDADLSLVLDLIVRVLPAPRVDPHGRLLVQVAKIEYDSYVGRIAVGRVLRGRARTGMLVKVGTPESLPRVETLKRLTTFDNLGRIDTAEAAAGDIIAVAGLSEVHIGDTISDAEVFEPLALVPIDEPTVSMVFGVNDGPMAGTEGEYVTSRHVRERLMRELEMNVALRVGKGPSAESLAVSGRGVMHLGVLIESMRREGYEFTVSRPEVILREIDGAKHEPIERLVIEVPEMHAGKAMELVGRRRGELMQVETSGALQRLEFSIPARGLIGLRTRLLTSTRGEAVMHHVFLRYERHKGLIPGRSRGVMISAEAGPAVPYALFQLKDRGTFFVSPGAAVYEGMIVGEHCRPGDLVINPCRTKKLTNIRAAAADDAVILTPPVRFNLEEALEYLATDELLEVTPHSLRLRKRLLTENLRKQARRRVPRSASGLAHK